MTRISLQASETQSPTRVHRVLYLIDRLHSIEAGAEGVVHKLCRVLPEHGFHCSVATFGVGDGVEQQFSCPLHVLPFSKPDCWGAVRNGWTLAKLLRSQRIEIVHTFFPVSDVWGGIVARLAGCPILISSRRDMGILRSRNRAIQYRVTNRLFTQVQAVSERVREFCIREDRLSPDKVVTVPNGVDLTSIDECQPADRWAVFGVGGGVPVITTVANLRPVKGIDTLVQAAPVVCREFPDAIFAVIGEAHKGDYGPSLQDLATDLGVAQNFRFLGRRRDVYALLKASDLFCLPSRSEGMSNALLEGMACHLPCVATNVGGNPEVIVDGQSGFLAPPDDPKALAERILEVLRSPNRGRPMGIVGRRVVEAKFTFSRMVKRLSFLYYSLLHQRGLQPTLESVQNVNSVQSEAPPKRLLPPVVENSRGERNIFTDLQSFPSPEDRGRYHGITSLPPLG